VQIEFHQLELKYQDTRLFKLNYQERLITSLRREGQKQPALVIKKKDSFVLIDGYQRVAALQQIGKDFVDATVLEMSEIDALLLSFRLATHRGNNILEEAWLLKEICDQQQKNQSEIAKLLDRSVSWVSRRLSLAKYITTAMKSAIVKEEICIHAVMKYIVPLARANKTQAELLLSALTGHKLSERQVCSLYSLWRTAKPKLRQKIVTDPLLYLKLEEETKNKEAPPGEAQDRQIIQDFNIIASICWRLKKAINERNALRPSLPWPSLLRFAWQEAQNSFSSIMEIIILEQSK